MHAQELFDRQRTTFSFEFFPPRTAETAEQLYAAITDLEALKPTFVSITYGAGGSTRELTHDLVLRLKNQTTLLPVPHLTCVGHSEAEIRGILERYAAAGISNIVALGGDLPKGMEQHDRTRDAFGHAADLVRFIKKFNAEGGHPDPRGFGVCVAGYPEGHPGTPNRVREMDHLKAKVDAGADWICTQLFFDNRDFYDFRDRCGLAGITVPIIAGIMPVTSGPGMSRMAELALGTRFPAPLVRAVNRAQGDAEGVRRVGIHWATEQCRDLLDHQVRGIHFYTLNRSTATREVFLNLGVKDSHALTTFR
ncbi:MAG: methylenetetrahydrofolate reductase [NAD(P)H] [Phycisphaeraceae bacterium]|nr:methylenetetrahydrofolate reductase [NAD(P)H] [Phycisphaeraceae bacterium]MBX3407557.1 methylenetetrahydrofolate reductase [NAD(P)H] [Phycisphaeraceae bacterium]